MTQLRSGVRALPPRTQDGAVPLVGRVGRGEGKEPAWVVTGLGSRGLVYHGLFGEAVGRAGWRGEAVPEEYTAWKEREARKGRMRTRGKQAPRFVAPTTDRPGAV